MSNKAINWAYGQTLKSGPKFVLVTLSDYADENDSCYPLVRQISHKTGISDRSVRQHLFFLEEHGFLTRKRQRNEDGTLGRYRFKLLINQPAAKSATGEKEQKPAAKSAGHNRNPQLNPQSNGVFEELWAEINPKLLRSRRKNKRKAREQFIRLAKEFGETELGVAVRAYYRDERQSKNDYEFAAAFTSMFSDRKFEGYLGQYDEPVQGGKSAWDIHQEKMERTA